MGAFSDVRKGAEKGSKRDKSPERGAYPLTRGPVASSPSKALLRTTSPPLSEVRGLREWSRNQTGSLQDRLTNIEPMGHGACSHLEDLKGGKVRLMLSGAGHGSGILPVSREGIGNIIGKSFVRDEEEKRPTRLKVYFGGEGGAEVLGARIG
ncbi:hypothetical protein LIER_33915 [Lithospermum erythrorhizon]|uniref:Uncharacterized protein n=1 Tax=Lithospermum erythrorhizon TaxID=34254 RepID=A0AAV3S217_LITER